MVKKYFLYILKFVALVLLQVLILDNVLLFGYANPYIYILFILFLPTTINRSKLLLIGFILGLFVDMFNNTGGVHAASTLVISFLRPFILRMSFGLSYDYNTLNIPRADIKSKVVYFTLIILIHHTFLFGLEYFSLDQIDVIIKNIAFSFLLTEIFILIFVKLLNYK